MKLNVAFKSVTKGKRNLISQIFNGKYFVEEKLYRASADVELKLVDKSALLNKGISLNQELFYHQSFFEFNLNNISLHIDGGAGLIDGLVNLVLNDLRLDDQSLGGKLKALLSSFVAPYLHPHVDESNHENVELGGIRINQYAKVLLERGTIYLSLHPYLAGAGVEMAPVIVENEQVIGKTVNLNFTTHTSFATIDKKLVGDLLLKGKEISRDLNQKSDPAAFTRLMDQLFHSSDETKPSLWHQYRSLLNHYPELLAAIGVQLSGERIAPMKAVTSLSGIDSIYLAMGPMVFLGCIKKLLMKWNSQGPTRPIAVNLKTESLFYGRTSLILCSIIMKVNLEIKIGVFWRKELQIGIAWFILELFQ